jgi:5'-deoxy-5'-methylthioadenosine phosphorylase
MTRLAIIGGSGFTQLENFQIISDNVVTTPFGAPSASIVHGTIGNQEVVFLARHGVNHSVPPHQINYRANIWALHHLGAQRIISIATVGGIHPDMPPQTLVIPDQIVDYTHSRQHTFFEQEYGKVTHVDFSYPYCEMLRQGLMQAAAVIGETIACGGTYGATQGPRLETAGEIRRMELDGCDVVGMTGMPEAALARELEMCYACCALVVNWAAGKSDGIVEMAEIEQHLRLGMNRIRRLLQFFIAHSTLDQ